MEAKNGLSLTLLWYTQRSISSNWSLNDEIINAILGQEPNFPPDLWWTWKLDLLDSLCNSNYCLGGRILILAVQGLFTIGGADHIIILPGRHSKQLFHAERFFLKYLPIRFCLRYQICCDWYQDCPLRLRYSHWQSRDPCPSRDLSAY